ncbi:MAG: radical SAM protein [Myxococcales bacterium]|nr:radical SAM protein [Sorangiineae bacterium PRO1]MCL4753913.1 radical SAM protein [Myxococcales bacterium]
MREVVDGLGYVPKSCTWELTLACDLRCGHCGSRAGSPRANELERPRLLQIAQELADLGCRRITLSGGEPTLSKHWEAVGAAASGRGIAVNMITNAARADRELVRRARDAGLVSIAASLDGLEATHDRHRRSPGSFGRVMQLIDDCHAVGLPVGVITTLQKRNVRELEQMEVLLRGRIYVWQLQLGAAMGNLLDHKDEQLEPRDLLHVIPALAALVESSPLNVRIANNVGYYGPYEATLRRHRSSPVECWVGCYAGCRHVGIQSDGSVKGCLSLQATQKTEGSLAEEGLSDIWHRDGAFAYNRSFSKHDLSGFCRTCEYAGVCRGGCFSMRTCEGGSENPYCYHRVATLDARALVRGKRRYAPLTLAPAALLAAFNLSCAADKPQGPPPGAPTADPFPGEPPSAEEYAAPAPEPTATPEPEPPIVAEYAVVEPEPPMTEKYGVPPPK